MVAIQHTDDEAIEPVKPLRANGLRVLLVERRAETREMLGELLEALGYEVATTGNAAGAHGIDSAPEAVVVDLSLPGGAAFDLLRELRAQPGWEAVRGVALCSREDSEQIRRAGEAGYATVLAKPISIWALHAALHEGADDS
jgi:DNA-binding response OmpR family regulator